MCDALRQTFDYGGLADTRFAHENGVVLGAPRENLQKAPDFFIPSYDRIELLVARELREIETEALQHAVLGFRFRVGDAMGSPHFFQCLVDLLAVDAGFLQNLVRIATLSAGNCDKEMLGANVLIFEADRLSFRHLKHLLGAWRQVVLRLSALTERDVRPRTQCVLQLSFQLRSINTEGAQHLRHQTVVLLEQRQ